MYIHSGLMARGASIRIGNISQREDRLPGATSTIPTRPQTGCVCMYVCMLLYVCMDGATSTIPTMPQTGYVCVC